MQASGTLHADEATIPGTTIADIDMFIFRDFYEKEYGLGLDQTSLPQQKLLNNLKLMRGPNLTLSGLLLFGERPSKHRPQFIIKAVTFIGPSITGDKYLDSEDIEGIILNHTKMRWPF